MGGHTKLSSALEDMRERTTETVNDVAASNKFVRIGKQIDEISKSLGVPKHKPTSMKDRWRRLLERRGDLKEKYKGSEIVKTSEPPPPKGVSLKEWDKILQKQAGKYGKNSAGFDLQGKTEVQGLPIAIENRVGSVREGENDDGSKWRTKFRTPYGYLEGTKGADGDEIDTYVGPDKKSDKAVVVHQKNPDGSHDEDTVMLGYPTAGAAKKDILRHYEDKSQLGGSTVMTVDELKARIARADGKKVEKLSSVSSDSESTRGSKLLGAGALTALSGGGATLGYEDVREALRNKQRYGKLLNPTRSVAGLGMMAAAPIGLMHAGRLVQSARKEKKASLGSEQASLNFRDGDSPQMTGAPAKLRRRRGEGPSRMGDLYPPAKAENRQDIQQTKQMEGFNTTEGFDDVGKMASATKARGLKRVGQLLSGSRVQPLSAKASAHRSRMVKHLDDMDSFTTSPGSAPKPTGRVVGLNEYKKHKGTDRYMDFDAHTKSFNAYSRESKASRKVGDIAGKERLSVSKARAGAALGVGVPVVALSTHADKKKAEAPKLASAWLLPVEAAALGLIKHNESMGKTAGLRRMQRLVRSATRTDPKGTSGSPLTLAASRSMDKVLRRSERMEGGSAAWLKTLGLDTQDVRPKKYRSDIEHLVGEAKPQKVKSAESMGKDRALGDQRKSWEGPTRDSVGRGLPEKHRLQTATGQEAVVLNDISTSVGQDESKTASKAKRLRAGLELAAEEAVRVGHGKSRDREKTASVKLASLEEAMRSAFLEEATKLGYASGLDKLAASPAFDDMVKEAIFKQLAGGLKRGLVGGMSPQGIPMKGMLGGLKGSGGRMAGVGQRMKTSPMQRIQSAGASAGDAQQLAQQAQRFGVKAPGVGKRIAGEAVQGAGQHVQHASKTQLALNPLGTVIGGGIEGGTRGAGKELVRSTGLAGKAGGGGMRAGVGRAMQKHAPKAGLAGEIATLGALGGMAHVPLSGAGALGTGMAKASPFLAKGLGVLGQVGGHVGADAIGTMAQRAGRLAPAAARALPGALTAMGAHTGRLMGRAA